MENDTALIIKPGQKRWREKAEELNRHIGLLTLGVTVSVGLSSTLIKALIYTYEMGKLSYWGIETTYISVLQGSRLYDLFFYIAVTILFCGINLIPYKILTSAITGFKKFLYTALTILISACFYLGCLIINICHGIGPNSLSTLVANKALLIFLIVSSIFLSMLTLGVGLMLGAARQIEKRSIQKRRKRNETERKQTEQRFASKKNTLCVVFLLVVMYFAICVIVVYFSGYADSKNQKEYKTVGNGQVVLCENEDSYLIAKCEEREENGERVLYINSNVQTEIEKTDIITVKVCYDEVWLMNSEGAV